MTRRYQILSELENRIDRDQLERLKKVARYLSKDCKQTLLPKAENTS